MTHLMPTTRKNTIAKPKKAAPRKTSPRQAAIKKVAPPEKFDHLNELHKKTTFLP